MNNRTLISQAPSLDSPRLTTHQLGRWLLDGADLPVVLVDDLNYAPLVMAVQHGWRWDAAHRWGDLERDPEPDDDPDQPEAVQALILTTREYL